jgi:hypothetical protein
MATPVTEQITFVNEADRVLVLWFSGGKSVGGEVCYRDNVAHHIYNLYGDEDGFQVFSITIEAYTLVTPGVVMKVKKTWVPPFDPSNDITDEVKAEIRAMKEHPDALLICDGCGGEFVSTEAPDNLGNPLPAQLCHECQMVVEDKIWNQYR